MAINLWEASGKPTSYNPVPITIGIPIEIGSYRIKIRFFGLVNKALRVFLGAGNASGWGGQYLYADGWMTYEIDIEVTAKTTFNVSDYHNAGTIIIEDIKLVEKPLDKPTINGLDGFLSGKWAFYGTGATIIDDETLELFSVTTTQGHDIFVDVMANTTYTFSFKNLASGMSGIVIRNVAEQTLVGSHANSGNPITFTTNVNTTRIYIRMFNYYAGEHIIFSRPMLNLGSTPAPYEPKRGECMVEPVVKKNYAQNLEQVTAEWTKILDYKDLQQNQKYTVHTLGSRVKVAKAYFSGVADTLLDSTNIISTFEYTNDAKSKQMSVFVKDVGEDLEGKKVQLEKGTIATPYEPYAVQINKHAKEVNKQSVRNPPSRTGVIMDGVTNYLQLPSITMDSVEIDCLIDEVQKGSSYYLFDNRFGGTSGFHYFAFADWVTGGEILSVAGSIRGTRTKVKIQFKQPFSDDVSIFSRYNAIEHTNGTIYGVKCFLNGKVVAEYDFTKENEKANTVLLGKKTWNIKQAKR